MIFSPYSCVRIVLGFLVLWGCKRLIKRSKSTHKRFWAVCAVVAASAVVFAAGFAPVENAFMTFSTPEAVLKYCSGEKMKAIIRGEHSALTISEDDKYRMLPKSENGWKIGVGPEIKYAYSETSGDLTINVFEHRGSNDQYVCVASLDGKNLIVQDNRASKFYRFVSMQAANGDTYYAYCAYVDELGADYTITVNGTEVHLTNKV